MYISHIYFLYFFLFWHKDKLLHKIYRKERATNILTFHSAIFVTHGKKFN